MATVRALVVTVCLVMGVSAMADEKSQASLVRKRGVNALAEGAAVPTEEFNMPISSLVRTRKAANALVEGGVAVPTDELKDMLVQVLQNPQMKAMAKDPNMVRGLMELMHDPEKMEHLTGNADLAQSLSALVEKDPHALTQLMKDAGFEVGMSLEDVSLATMEEIHAEFVRLSKSDDGIMQRLKKNNWLREHLKKTLGGVVDNAMRDTNRVTKRLAVVKEGKRSITVTEDGSLFESMKKDRFQDLQELTTVEEIESALDELAKQINKKIMGLHAQDDVELKALEDNAKLRAAMKDKLQEYIKEQQQELSFASDVESQTFSKF